MLQAILGKKIGMTQLFDDNHNVLPVTVVYIGRLLVTQVKTEKNDGYISVQLGLVKKKFQQISFSFEWLKNKKDFFEVIKEVVVDDSDALDRLKIGQEIDINALSLEKGTKISVSGITLGKGFQGVVKRWNFHGGPRSHGSMFHRAPGSISNMRSQGEVLKGKKLPGHDGARRITIKGLKVVQIDNDNRCVLIKGSVPGKKNSLLIMQKQR